MLKGKTGKEFFLLWDEFEEMRTLEAKFVRAIDKFEVILQHNVAGVKTWDEGDFRYALNKIQDTPFDFNGFMRKLKNYLDDRTYKIVKKAGVLSKVPDENIKRYQDKENKI